MGHSLPPPPYAVQYGTGAMAAAATADHGSGYRHPQQYVKYVPVGFVQSHSVLVGYLFWIVGFTGAHRFYYGKPLTGLLWFFTFGLLGIGWIIDLFLIPSMATEATTRYRPGSLDYNLAWLLFYFGGLLGLHRMYMGKWITGIIYLLTLGCFGIGWLVDLFCLNEQVHEKNWHREMSMSLGRY